MTKETKLVNTLTTACKGPLAIAFLLSLGAVGCHEPTPKCSIAQSQTSSGFAARYTLVDGSKTGKGDCDSLTSESVSVGAYLKPKKDNSPNYDKVSVAIQPSGTVNANGAVAGIVGTPENPKFKPEADNSLYAFGAFDSSKPGKDDFCHISKMAPAQVRYPAYNAYMAPDPSDMTGKKMILQPAGGATDVVYDFTEVKVYMTPESIGVTFAADLTYTNGGCTAKYKVDAIFPQTSCGAPDDPNDPNTGYHADPSLCKIDAFRDYDVECDKTTNLCVLAKAAPSLK